MAAERETGNLLKTAAKNRQGEPYDTMLGNIWKQFKRHPAALVGLTALLIIALTAVLAPLMPYDPNAVQPLNRWAHPSREHLLGTDQLGRDVATRLFYGGRISLGVGLLAVLTSVIIGCTVGIPAGYFGGQLDNVLMRLVDFVLCFPRLYLLILLFFLLGQIRVPVFQSGIGGIVLVIGLTSWTTIARLVRACFLSVKNEEFVTAARAYGARDIRIMLFHILPNAIGPIVVNATMGVAWAILSESGLSFLGFGIQPPAASWGNMLSNAQQVMSLYPWLAIAPGLMIFFTVLSVNFVGDALQDAFDPKRLVRREIG